MLGTAARGLEYPPAMKNSDTALADTMDPLPEGLPLPSRPYVPVVPGQTMWVFAYGSLMWNPGFPFVCRRTARLFGYHRRFCIYSHRYRGTPQVPGLVLGLDRGGSCRGIAFLIAPDHVPEVLAYLWHREMVSGVYRPRMGVVELIGDGVENGTGNGNTEVTEHADSPARQRVKACTFVADPDHRQYCNEHETDRLVALIRQGHGVNGPNWEYLANTVEHLEELDIHDRALETLLGHVRAAMGL